MERKAYPNIVRAGAQWRMMPNDLPPWHTVYQQTRRWLKAGVFEDMVRDLRMLMREINDRMPQPGAAILDSRTVQSTPESDGRAGYDGHKRRKGSKVHLAVDTLGQLLAVWKWSSYRRPSTALCCCLAAGSSNAASLGWRASVGWHATTNACLRHWSKDAQVDVVAVRWDEKQILLGEAKWGTHAVGRKVLADLMAKAPKVVPDRGEGWTVHYALFARAGFTGAVRADAAQHKVLLVDLETLGRGLGQTS